jgi:hypothetical protein
MLDNNENNNESVYTLTEVTNENRKLSLQEALSLGSNQLSSINILYYNVIYFLINNIIVLISIIYYLIVAGLPPRELVKSQQHVSEIVFN